MIYLVLAVLFLHIIVVPITVSVDIDVDSDKKSGKIVLKVLFIPVFVKQANIDDIKKLLYRGKKTEDRGHKKKKWARKNAFKHLLIDAAFKLLSRIRTREMYMTCMIGTGDGFSTAMTVSTVKIMYSQLCAFLGYSDDTSDGIAPNYDDECIFMRFNGIFSMCFADIIYVMLCALSGIPTRGKAERRKIYAHHNVAE